MRAKSLMCIQQKSERANQYYHVTLGHHWTGRLLVYGLVFAGYAFIYNNHTNIIIISIYIFVKSIILPLITCSHYCTILVIGKRNKKCFGNC